MANSNIKDLIFEHGQRYVREVLADHLREEGFISKNDVHWYRLINNQILQSIFFHTSNTFFPLFLEISYGCHPLFTIPEFPKGVYMFSTGYLTTNNKKEKYTWGGTAMSMRSDKTNAPYSREACVMCATDDAGKRETVDKIFAELEQVTTEEVCYQKHKKYYLETFKNNMERLFYSLSMDFMDEVIYFNDTELYPFCEKKLEWKIASFNQKKQENRLPKSWEKEVDRFIALRRAIVDGEREKHLEYLESQRKKTIQLLQKKLDITVELK